MSFMGDNKVLCTPDDPNPDEFACSALYHKGSTKSAYKRPGLTSRKNIRVSLKGVGAGRGVRPMDRKKEVSGSSLQR